MTLTLIFDLDNLVNNGHSYVDHLWQVSLKSVHKTHGRPDGRPGNVSLPTPIVAGLACPTVENIVKVHCNLHGKYCGEKNKEIGHNGDNIEWYNLAVTVHRCLRHRAPLVPRRLLCASLRSSWSPASAICQMSSTVSSASSSQHFRDPRIFCRQTNSLEFTARSSARSSCWLRTI